MRRRGITSTFAAGLALLSAGPASAFLGFGEPSKEDVYKDETVRRRSEAVLWLMCVNDMSVETVYEVLHEGETCKDDRPQAVSCRWLTVDLGGKCLCETALGEACPGGRPQAPRALV